MCPARYSPWPQPLTNQPTRHRMSRQGLYVPTKAYFEPNILIILAGRKSFDIQISENHLSTSFTFFCQAGHQMDRKASTWPIMTRNACFGPNLAVFGPNLAVLGLTLKLGRWGQISAILTPKF